MVKRCKIKLYEFLLTLLWLHFIFWTLTYSMHNECVFKFFTKIQFTIIFSPFRIMLNWIKHPFLKHIFFFKFKKGKMCKISAWHNELKATENIRHSNMEVFAKLFNDWELLTTTFANIFRFKYLVGFWIRLWKIFHFSYFRYVQKIIDTLIQSSFKKIFFTFIKSEIRNICYINFCC